MEEEMAHTQGSSDLVFQPWFGCAARVWLLKVALAVERRRLGGGRRRPIHSDNRSAPLMSANSNRIEMIAAGWMCWALVYGGRPTKLVNYKYILRNDFALLHRVLTETERGIQENHKDTSLPIRTVSYFIETNRPAKGKSHAHTRRKFVREPGTGRSRNRHEHRSDTMHSPM
uniref:Uncharacterized protein n=1 Tax=Oryza punctata TaxID=4537 RepID=A0A0E0L3U9_ORYPU